MSGLESIVFNIELTLIIGVITSFVIGFLLMLIKVPNTEYSRRIASTKNTIAVCFLVCSALFYTCLRYSGIHDYEVFSSMMMFVVNAVSSAILSFSLINLLSEKVPDNDRFYLNLGVVVVFSILYMKSFWMDEGWLRVLLRTVSIILFILQCVTHIVVFHKAYISTVRRLEYYYDEDEEQKVKWIHFCYAIMMLTQMFILVYLLLPRGFMKIYILWYSIFILYFTANFISFLGSHKLLLDAFAYKTLSGQELKARLDGIKRRRKKEAEGGDELAGFNEAEFARIEKALDIWVEEKRYCEYDKSREEIARELHTSRELLHMYFSVRLGVDFKTWRTVLRVEEAKRLLLENKDLSTNIIGERAGFSDRSNFHRQFVRIAGCTPKQWRESDGAFK